MTATILAITLVALALIAGLAIRRSRQTTQLTNTIDDIPNTELIEKYPPPTGYVAITGIITDEHGNGVEGITVEARTDTNAEKKIHKNLDN